MLERLDRANLFLVPLDDQRRWYRYHHLFGDLLRSRLLDEHDDVAELHRRASNWHDQNGEPVAAVRHALAAGDLDRAADLVELAVPELRRNRQEGTLRQWIDQLPDSVVDRRPVLAMGFVGALMSNNEFDDIERRLAVIEQTLNAADAGPRSWSSSTRPNAARLAGGIELYRAALALLGGDPTGTLEHAQLAVDLAPDEDDLTRASAAALVGLAAWTIGDLEAAHRGYTDAADGLRRLGTPLGRPGLQHHARRHRDHPGQAPAGTADLRARPRSRRRRDPGCAAPATCTPDWRRSRWSATTCWRAAEHLRRADELGEAGGLPQDPYRWRVAMALAPRCRGRPREPRWRCSRRPTGSTSATSRRTCSPSRRCVRGCWLRTATYPQRWTGRARTALARTTSSRTCASTST